MTGPICEGVLNHPKIPPQGWSKIGSNKSSPTRINGIEVQNKYSTNPFCRYNHNSNMTVAQKYVSLLQKANDKNILV